MPASLESWSVTPATAGNLARHFSSSATSASLAWLTWYTYGPNGHALGEAGQRWYTAQAVYVPATRSVPMTLYETTGGMFDKSTPAPTTVPIGTATVTFMSCTRLNLDFHFTGGSSAGTSGTINMTRVGPAPVGCGP